MTLRDLIESSRTDGKKAVHEAAQNIGCSWKTLDNYLLGRTQLGPQLLKKLAEFLSLPLNQVPQKISPHLFGVKKQSPTRVAEAEVPYRTKPNFKAGILLRRCTTEVLIDELAGLLKDDGVEIPDRIENGELLFDEIKRRLQEQASSAEIARELLAKAVAAVEAETPSAPASARGNVVVLDSGVPPEPPTQGPKH